MQQDSLKSRVESFLSLLDLSSPVDFTTEPISNVEYISCDQLQDWLGFDYLARGKVQIISDLPLNKDRLALDIGSWIFHPIIVYSHLLQDFNDVANGDRHSSAKVAKISIAFFEQILRDCQNLVDNRVSLFYESFSSKRTPFSFSVYFDASCRIENLQRDLFDRIISFPGVQCTYDQKKAEERIPSFNLHGEYSVKLWNFVLLEFILEKLEQEFSNPTFNYNTSISSYIPCVVADSFFPFAQFHPAFIPSPQNTPTFLIEVSGYFTAKMLQRICVELAARPVTDFHQLNLGCTVDQVRIVKRPLKIANSNRTILNPFTFEVINPSKFPRKSSTVLTDGEKEYFFLKLTDVTHVINSKLRPSEIVVRRGTKDIKVSFERE